MTCEPADGNAAVNGGWKYVIRCPSEKSFESITATLRLRRSIYLPMVRRREGFLIRLIDPPRGGSLTFSIVWTVIRATLISLLWVLTPVSAVFASLPIILGKILAILRGLSGVCFVSAILLLFTFK